MATNGSGVAHELALGEDAGVVAGAAVLAGGATVLATVTVIGVAVTDVPNMS
jgi:hypothetical protein